MARYAQTIFICGFALLTSCCSYAWGAKHSIDVMTEATPLTLRAGPEADGEATVFVKAVLERAHIEYTFSFIPWKRSYRYAQTRDNILIYPIARTEARSRDFIWIGKIIPIDYFLFKLRSRERLNIETIEDAKRFTIGVVNDHVHHEYLLEEGFTDIQAVNSNEQNLRKLLLRRIDFFPMSGGGLLPLCTQLKIDCDLIEPALALEEFSDGLYMAYSRNTRPEIIQRTTAAYNELVSSEYYQSLFSTRLKNAERFRQRWIPQN